MTYAGDRWAVSGSEHHYETIVCLLHNGADLRQSDSQGRTILVWTAARGDANLLRIVLATAQVSMPQHSIRQHTSAYTSAYVQHSSVG